MGIVFLINHLPNPRILKRINIALLCAKTSVIFWNRCIECQPGNKLPEETNQYELAVPANCGNPLMRIGATFKFGFKALEILKSIHPQCIHTTKMDMLFWVWLYCFGKKKKPYIIYEVADLHDLTFGNAKSNKEKLFKFLLTTIEKLLCKRVDTLIITSEYFYKEYYAKFIDKKKVLFIPNAPQRQVFKDFIRKTEGPFTIGFIGSVRYKTQLELMIKAAKTLGLHVLIAGYGPDYQYFEKKYGQDSDICIYGGYEYNEDIAKLYSMIDCVYAVYDEKKRNVKVALPNRLYEAIICSLPLIAARDTLLGKMVEDMNIGLTAKSDDEDGIQKALNRIANEDVIYWEFSENCKKYVDNLCDIKKCNQLLKEKYVKMVE